MVSPIELAQEFAKISSTSFLAHTIRKMEERIYQLSTQKGDTIIHRINVIINPHISHAFCNLARKNSTIFLPEPQNIEDEVQLKELRLKLAHELGHIALRLAEISDPKYNLRLLENFNMEEEIKSWVFAYELIKQKNLFHKSHSCDKFCYRNDNAIIASIEDIIKNSGHQNIKDMLIGLKKAGISYK